MPAFLRSYGWGSGLVSGAVLLRCPTERFFFKALARFGTETLGGSLLQERDDLFAIAGGVHKRVVGVALCFVGKLWRTPGSFCVRESGTMRGFPRITPMGDRKTVDQENGPQGGGISALRAQ